MTKPEPSEVLFEIIDGIEYATLHADNFRVAMRERDRFRTTLLKIADDSAHADQYVQWAQEALDDRGLR